MPSSPTARRARRHACTAMAAAAAFHAAAHEPAAPVARLAPVVVSGELAFRDRTTDTAPTLTYGQEYFQRFEPATAGDMVKRVPSAAFVSDVLEFDAVRLRGLAPAYTQVLVNGKPVPGGADDRSFWLDRIPAEMVERVEVLRSASAHRSGDAVAGAINIVLRDAHKMDGQYLRAGLTHHDDGRWRPTLGVVSSGDALDGRLLVSLNLQDRYNPKRKRSDRFDAPGGELVSFEDQADTRDGRDQSATLAYSRDLGPGRLKLDGFAVQTDRQQVEVSTETERDGADTVVSRVPGLTDVKQRNWGLGAGYRFPMADGTSSVDWQHAGFRDRSVEQEESYSIRNGLWDESEGEKTGFDSRDREVSLKLAHRRSLSAADGMVDLLAGLDLRRKNRLTRYTEFVWEADSETDPVDYQPDGAIASTIREKRVDPYLEFTGRSGRFDWEAGLRHERTEADVVSASGAFHNRYGTLLPSLHLKTDLGADTRLSLSLARTVRRPAFNELVPERLDGEYGDNDYRGDPALRPETARGLDLGIEHRLGRRGVVGLNLFYRQVRQLIELVNTGEPSEAALENWQDDVQDYMDAQGVDQATAEAAVPLQPDSFVYTSRNVGRGKVWGLELDLAAPLDALGFADTGVFLNLSWLSSAVTDFLGTRRFNNQARSLYNIGFIRNLPAWPGSFGASYRRQGRADSRVLGEEVRTTYGADLELFVERHVDRRFSVRLAATNLLNARKKEVIQKFATLEDQIARRHEEYEIETEKAGARLQLVARWAF